MPLPPLPSLPFSETSHNLSASSVHSNQSTQSHYTLSPHSSPPNYHPLALFRNSPPNNSLLSLPPPNQSHQSILEKSSSTSEDDGALTENTSLDGFTPPSKQNQFELAPSLPVLDSDPSPSTRSYEPLPIDTTPPRLTAGPSTENFGSSLHLSSNRQKEETTADQPTTIRSEVLRSFATSNGFSDPSAGPSRSSQSPRPSGLPLSDPALRSPSAPSRPPRNAHSLVATPPTVSPRSQLSLSSSPRQLGASESSTRSKNPTRAVALAAAREREMRETSIAASVSQQEEAVEEMRPGRNLKAEALARPSDPQRAVESRPRSPMEVAFATCTRPILKIVLPFIEYRDVVSLRQTSRTLKRSLETDGRELILERFLGGQGYRSLYDSNRETFLLSDDLISLDLRDLSVFRAAQNLTLDEYSSFARAYVAGNISPSRLRLARATTRAHNRVVLRLRTQTILPPSSFSPPSFPELRQVKQTVYKAPRAPQLRVWVPTVKGQSWMSDQELIECERELFRSGKGVWPQLRKGDVVYNTAIDAFGNCGRLLFDGRYLRDLAFDFDVVGHCPVNFQFPEHHQTELTRIY